MLILNLSRIGILVGMGKTANHICVGCGHIGNIYDFSPSIQIGENDFRIFHSYNKMNGHLYCVECKKRHLIKISEYKKFTIKQIIFLKNSLKNEQDWNGK